MDIAGIAKAASSIAETGNKQEVDLAVLRRAQQIEKSTATQLVDAIQSVPTPNLPAHLGTKINTTA
ncbi:MAG TPA: YjfB family protein [Telluria sp.]|nr:YjfB family protein [Telluria sp.]